MPQQPPSYRAQVLAQHQPPTAHVVVDDGRTLAVTSFRVDSPDFTELRVGPHRETDPGWRFVDPAGHEHRWEITPRPPLVDATTAALAALPTFVQALARWVAEPQTPRETLPTLRAVERTEPCPGWSDTDPYHDAATCEGVPITDYRCLLCDVLVEPGTRPHPGGVVGQIRTGAPTLHLELDDIPRRDAPTETGRVQFGVMGEDLLGVHLVDGGHSVHGRVVIGDIRWQGSGRTSCEVLFLPDPPDRTTPAPAAAAGQAPC